MKELDDMTGAIVDSEKMVNDADSYAVYRKALETCEEEFERSPFDALVKMSELFVKLQDTYFHDLYDSIGLWFDRYGDENLLNYLLEKNDPDLIQLQETIERKISNFRSK